MIEILLFFLAASLLLYVLLGGSDYGAGILELLPAGKLRDRQKAVIGHAMGPVWEANHIWIILVVVILFVGFPSILTTLSIALHVPLMALLTGIVVRGSMFTFRYYDAIQDEKSQRVYTTLFAGSSLWTAFWLGVIAATLHRGTIPADVTAAALAGATPWDLYFAPWIGICPAASGVFVACAFAFLASTYLVGETGDEDLKKLFRRRSAFINAVMAAAGILVLATSEVPVFPVASFVAFLVCLAATVFFRNKNKTFLTCLFAGGQVTIVLLAWILTHGTTAITTAAGTIDFYDAVAPRATQFQLVAALLAGSCIIFPALFYMLKVFKASSPAGAK